MDLTPKLLTASVLFALAEQKYGKELRSRMRLDTGRASVLFVVIL